MNLFRLSFLLSMPFLWSCDSSTSRVAGTNDETSTSLQILADNVKSIGSSSSPASARRLAASRALPLGFAARSLAGSTDTGHWVPNGFYDHGTWGSWSLQWNGSCIPVADAPSTCITRDTILINDTFNFSSEEETWTQVGSQYVAVSVSGFLENRSGFKYEFHLRSTTDTTTDRSVEDSGSIVVPQLGIAIQLPAGWGTNTQLPVLLAGNRIGTALLGNFGELRWFDLTGKEYLGAPLPRTTFGPDSLGMHLVSRRPDTVAGKPGLRLTGWYSMPDRYGMVTDSVWASVEKFTPPDSSDPAGYSGTSLLADFRKIPLSTDGTIDYFLPLDELHAVDSTGAWSPPRLVALPLVRAEWERGIIDPAGGRIDSDTIPLH
jgi:hypothetical protein